jgi:hypothetical protein
LADPIRFRVVDDTTRDQHTRLVAADKCLYLYDYTPGVGYDTPTNQLIYNIKKKPSERTTKGGWHYKARDMQKCSATLCEALNPKWLDIATLVPVPGSKILGHEDYDDRMEQICRGIREGLDVRNVVVQTQSTERAHEAGPGGHRITVEELLEIYRIDESLAENTPKAIGVFDDVLTAGTHFKAMQIKLSERFPDVPITGIFIARRVVPLQP